MDAIPLNILTLLADLDQTIALATEPAGSLYTQEIKGKPYVYLSVREGVARRKVYLGPAGDPTTEQRIEAARAAGTRMDQRRDLVRLLRSQGLPGPTTASGRVVEVLAAAGLFERGALLVGTVAYQTMGPLVGHHLPVATLTTQDADVATASLALAARPEVDSPEGPSDPPSLETILKRADPTFHGVPSLDRKALPARFLAQNGFLVEVLVPRLRREDPTPMPIKALKAGGMPLQPLDWLIHQPMPAVVLHGAGIRVRVPQPARYAVHKCIIAQKPERNPLKKAKDLEQAASLFRALTVHDPDALLDALADARSRGKSGWAAPLDRSLKALGLTDWLP